jgi:Site-specific recombinase XerD
VSAHIDLPRMSRLLPETLTQAEVERLLDAPPPDALLERALLELLYAAGLRISEALNLDLEDISLDGA